MLLKRIKIVFLGLALLLFAAFVLYGFYLQSYRPYSRDPAHGFVVLWRISGPYVYVTETERRIAYWLGISPLFALLGAGIVQFTKDERKGMPQ